MTRFGMRTGIAIVLTLVVVALAAPLLANDRPIAVTSDEGLELPAFGEVLLLGALIEHPAWETRDWTRPLPGERWRLPALIRHSYRGTDLDGRLRPPSAGHWLGTDSLGRDLAARVLHGARTSLQVGLVSTGVALAIGIVLGGLAGFLGRGFDMVVSRVVEIVLCFPTFFLILSVLAFLPPSLPVLFIVIGLTRWPVFARYTRGEVLRVRETDFVDAARLAGAGPLRTFFLHVLPHALTPALVVGTFSLAGAMLVEAGLSFLGHGVQEPQPSWGSLLNDGRETGHWWLVIFPGLALTLAITGLQLVGEGLRTRLDPRSARD